MEKELIDIIGDEFEKILSGPSITWDKKGMISAFNRACVNALIRYYNSRKV